MNVLVYDVRYGMRMLATNPGFTAVAVLTLALGIGANTAIFSVMNAALVRRLPVPEPEQLVRLHTTDQPPNTSQTGYNDTSLTEPVFEQLRQQRNVFSELVAYVPLSLRKVAVRFGGEPEEANADMVSGNFFSGLGVRVARGRAFTMEDETQHNQTAVLSYAYWSRRFARDPAVIGQTLYIKGVPFTIVGVAPREFGGVGQGAGSPQNLRRNGERNKPAFLDTAQFQKRKRRYFCRIHARSTTARRILQLHGTRPRKNYNRKVRLGF